MSGLGSMWIAFLVEGSGYLPATERDDLVQFYATHLDGAAPMSYARALELIDQRAEFQQQTCADLLAWFHGQ